MRTVIVEFEDQGQDFTWWEVNAGDGLIINCDTPMQQSIWNKYRVVFAMDLVEETKPGSSLIICNRNDDPQDLNTLVSTIKYPVKSINEKSYAID